MDALHIILLRFYRRWKYLADIESTLRYALTKEATSVEVMNGAKMNAMKTFIGALAKVCR